MSEDQSKPNPDYISAQDGDTIGAGLVNDKTYIDKWDERNHSIIRTWSDGKEERWMFHHSLTPRKLPNVLPIFFKRPVSE